MKKSYKDLNEEIKGIAGDAFINGSICSLVALKDVLTENNTNQYIKVTELIKIISECVLLTESKKEESSKLLPTVPNIQ